MKPTTHDIIDIGKLPPQDIELEEGILGSILIEPDCIDRVITILTPETFYKNSNQIIFKAILDLNTKNQNIDMLTVFNHLKTSGKLDEVGGSVYLSDLTNKVTSTSNLEQYAYIIKQNAIARELIQFASKIQNLAYDKTNDIADILDYIGNYYDKILQNVIGCQGGKMIKQIIPEAINQLERREKAAKKGEVTGIKTSINALTKMTSGFQNSELIILAGRPGMGKTAFALSSIQKAAEQNKSVVIFSLEMDGVRLVDRLICGQANIDAGKYCSGYLPLEDWPKIKQAAHELQELGIFIDDSALISMDHIAAKCKFLKKRGKCEFVVIDYLGLIEMNKEKGKIREQEVAEVVRKAKIMAKQLNIPVMLVCQLNRDVEKRGSRRPELADLRDSGAIEQDADMVLFVYRAEYYGTIEDEKGGSLIGKGELIVAKNRNGRIGSTFFGYNESLTRIFDYAEPWEKQQSEIHKLNPIKIREDEF